MELDNGLHHLSFPDMSSKQGGQDKHRVHFNKKEGGGCSDESPIRK
jgi:hypothetical protein